MRGVDGLLAWALATLSTCSPRVLPISAASRPTPEAVVPTTLVRAPTKIRILVGGDLMPHRPMLLPPEKLRDALEPLGPLLARADLAVANYETATGDPDLLAAHDISLVASPVWLRVAAEQFHALTVANNHACDLGRRGLEATLEAARDAHVIALGADDTTPWQARVLVEKDGKRVCA